MNTYACATDDGVCAVCVRIVCIKMNDSSRLCWAGTIAEIVAASELCLSAGFPILDGKVTEWHTSWPRGR
jgi:hypothetical protein